jgi:hypothetical protein
MQFRYGLKFGPTSDAQRPTPDAVNPSKFPNPT